MKPDRIPARSGRAFELKQGQFLTVIDPEGEQVSDMVAFNRHRNSEYLSSGRSIDYAGRLFLTTGDCLYSNRSEPMLNIIADDVGRHDFTLTPCSRDTFRIIYDDPSPHRGCQGNLEAALEPFGILTDAIPIAFNIFMRVDVEPDTGKISVEPPLSKPGDRIVFQAAQDLIVGLTACAAGQSNNFSYSPIDYLVSDERPDGKHN